MLTYTFSRREKTLLLVLAIMLILIAWYFLVFQSTNNQIASIRSQQSTVEEQAITANAQVADMNKMQNVIQERKAEGAKPTPIPTYDNIQPLMAELDAVMETTDAYELDFEELDTESTEYVLRPVSISFKCKSYAAAEKVVRSLAAGPYTCVVDSVSISDATAQRTYRVTGSTAARSNAQAVGGVIHVTFFEKNGD